MLSQETVVEFHELADIFPMMGPSEYTALKADIAEYGLREPITLAEGKIADGRNRYKACVELDIAPRYEEWDGEGSLLAFIVSMNLHRRHLDESQRAMVGARIATLPKGRPELLENPAIAGLNQENVGILLNTSSDSIMRAKKVLASGTPELVQAVEQGNVAVSMAAKMVKCLKEEQNRFAKLVTDGVRPTEARKTIVAERTQANVPLSTEKKYRVIYADPPWAYSNTSMEDFVEQGYHYRLMQTKEIYALPIKELVEDNAILFLWVTSPVLEESFQVINAWGFKYKASFVWDKVRHVMGHYNSVRHEFLLVCTRGSCQPDVRKLYDSVVSIERTGHSEKPEFFREIIDTLYPNGERIELFARKQTDGWDCYGNEVPRLEK